MRLLVSVRSAVEASRLDNGCCDIVDIKNPDAGPLGMATPETMSEILLNVRNTPVSAALGETDDWRSRDVDRLPDGLQFTKLGLAGDDRPGWQCRWSDVRTRFDARQPRSWVAVAYADSGRSDSPRVVDIVRAAAETGCAGVLIDTFTKMPGECVFDFHGSERLCEVRDRVREAGMFFALAGQLGVTHAARIAEIAPDVVGVRGAVCENGVRGRSISKPAVMRFRAALYAAVETNSTPTKTS